MIQFNELEKLNGAQIEEKLSKIREEGVRSLIEDMNKAFANENIKENLKKISDVLKVLKEAEEWYTSAEGEEVKDLYSRIYFDAYNEFKRICNKYGLSMDVRYELLRSKNVLNRQLIAEARNSVKKLSRQVNKVSESLKKRALKNEDRSKLSELEKKTEETCKKEKIIMGPIRRVWEAFKSSWIGRLFGLKTFEEKVCDRLMEELTEHNGLGPNNKLILEHIIKGIEQYIEELSKLSLAYNREVIIDSCTQIGEIVNKLLCEIENYNLSEQDQGEFLTKFQNAMSRLSGINKKAIESDLNKGNEVKLDKSMPVPNLMKLEETDIFLSQKATSQNARNVPPINQPTGEIRLSDGVRAVVGDATGVLKKWQPLIPEQPQPHQPQGVSCLC